MASSLAICGGEPPRDTPLLHFEIGSVDVIASVDSLTNACASAPRNGSWWFAEFSSTVVRIDCERCERAGSHRRDILVARFGPYAALPDVLMALASYERRADFSRPCGARFADLVNQKAHQRDR
jgi:hypothetical protein